MKRNFGSTCKIQRNLFFIVCHSRFFLFRTWILTEPLTYSPLGFACSYEQECFSLSLYNKFVFLSYCFLSYFSFFYLINNLAQDDARPVDEREMDNKLKATSVPVHRSSGGLEDACASNFKRESLTLQSCPCPACHCGHNTWGKFSWPQPGLAEKWHFCVLKVVVLFKNRVSMFLLLHVTMTTDTKMATVARVWLLLFIWLLWLRYRNLLLHVTVDRICLPQWRANCAKTSCFLSLSFSLSSLFLFLVSFSLFSFSVFSRVFFSSFSLFSFSFSFLLLSFLFPICLFSFIFFLFLSLSVSSLSFLSLSFSSL